MEEDEEAFFSTTPVHLDIAVRYTFKDIFGKRVTEERIFTTYFHSVQIGIEKPLSRHSFDRATIQTNIDMYKLRSNVRPSESSQ